MRRSTKRLVFMMAMLPVGLVVLGVLYQLGMAHLEGETRSLWASIEWAAETLTTTGYGHDNEWTHPVMQLYVVVVQFLGLFIVFLVFPVFLIPFFEERFEGRLPKALPRLQDHVVIYGWGPEVALLVEDLERAEVPVVIFEQNQLTARRLHDRGHTVTYANLDDDDPDLSTMKRAKGLVVNASDHENAVFVMSARHQGFRGTVVALVTNPRRRTAVQRSGADVVLTPKHALAAAIAARASRSITPRISGAPMLGAEVMVGEVRVEQDSSVTGKTLAEAEIGANTGVTVLGYWNEGELVPATAQTRLEAGRILVAAGAQDRMRKLAELAAPLSRTGPFLICGLGHTGGKVAEFLTAAGEQVVTIDHSAEAGADFVGDALDPEILSEAGVEAAQAVIVCLGHDSETVFAGGLVRDLAPDTIILAAAEHARSLPRLHRAGADFGFSIGQVVSQLISFQMLGQESTSVQATVKIARTEAGLLVGKNPLASEIRQRTGCSIVAVERDGVPVPLDKDLVVQAGDAMFISGTDSAVARYIEMFKAS